LRFDLILPFPMDGTPTNTPHAEYACRLEQRRAAEASLTGQYDRLAMLRGGVFLAGAVILWAAAVEVTSAWWLLLPLVSFVGLVIFHSRVAGRLALAKRAVTYYQTALDRLDDRWSDAGVTGQRYVDKTHPYTSDLDVFGVGSLFQLICRARTRLGEDRLAAWLRSAAEIDVVTSRQQAVEELRSTLDLREELALLDARVHEEIDQNLLREWAAMPACPVAARDRMIAVVLTVVSLTTLICWAYGLLKISSFILALAAQGVFLRSFYKRIRETADQAGPVGAGLTILARVLEILERQRFEGESLRTLSQPLSANGHVPSWQIVRLDTLIRNFDSALRNQFFVLLALLLGLHVHLMHAIERWRETIGSHIPEWLDAVGELEALSSLAGYAYEHPEYPFPNLADTADGPVLESESVGHPLLPKATCTRNSLSLGETGSLLLVSGSNMSGKSTLLRSVGTNVVLALAGAPVCAERLRLSRMVLGTAMRIDDSLQDGKSLFYSVLERLKSIVELSGQQVPLLFLLDEILQGTNSHDRRIGAEGVIRSLVERGAIGLVTTHDLALTEIVVSLHGRAANVHFEDRIVDGRMTFDYLLRDGVVQRSNALELMRLMGLDVPDRQDAVL
jgi:hypothetical protein